MERSLTPHSLENDASWPKRRGGTPVRYAIDTEADALLRGRVAAGTVRRP